MGRGKIFMEGKEGLYGCCRGVEEVGWEGGTMVGIPTTDGDDDYDDL